jgi:hypothetical protein
MEVIVVIIFSTFGILTQKVRIEGRQARDSEWSGEAQRGTVLELQPKNSRLSVNWISKELVEGIIGWKLAWLLIGLEGVFIQWFGETLALSEKWSCFLFLSEASFRPLRIDCLLIFYSIDLSVNYSIKYNTTPLWRSCERNLRRPKYSRSEIHAGYEDEGILFGAGLSVEWGVPERVESLWRKTASLATPEWRWLRGGRWWGGGPRSPKGSGDGLMEMRREIKKHGTARGEIGEKKTGRSIATGSCKGASSSRSGIGEIPLRGANAC